MADPLLTSLCAICRISSPKYKCPRCTIRTCSLACTKKHKAWAECSGERDATAYLPRRHLRTAAGIDHDYNFLYKMERAIERGEKEIVGERALVREEELRPMTVQEVKFKVGRDGRRRRVLVTRALREAKGRTFERSLAQKLRQINVTILCAPQGMARQVENKTTLNRRTGRINWQVEWLAIDTAAEEPAEDAKRQETRLLGKAMDDVPLYAAYQATVEERTRAANREKGVFSKSRRPGHQNAHDSTWNTQLEPMQEPSTAAWIAIDAASVSEQWPSERKAEQRARFDFFLGKPRQRSGLPTAVTKLNPDDCLRDFIRDTYVLEFPTIYVLPQGEDLPAGFVLEPKGVITRSGAPSQQQGQKRKNKREQRKSKFSKRRKPGDGGGGDMEDGELGSDNNEDQNDVDGDENGSLDASAGLEAGEVIDEQSLGEEDDENEDDDSPTSSSGSDSD